MDVAPAKYIGKQVSEQLIQPFVSHGKLQRGGVLGPTLKYE